MSDNATSTSPTEPPVREFSTRVAGIHYCRGNVHGLNSGELLRLVREPTNPYDSNAVRVETPEGILVGRIPRELAPSLAKDMDAGLAAHAVIQWTSSGHAPERPVYSRGGKLRKRGVKASPPECFICVKVGGSQPAMPNPPERRFSVTPSRQPPSPPIPPRPIFERDQANPRACFVATAVFGNQEHPTVAALRCWRDSQLSRRRVGLFLITVYEVAGPQMARFVLLWPSSRLVLRPLLGAVAKAVNRAGRKEL